jgi:hypothetical protein
VPNGQPLAVNATELVGRPGSLWRSKTLSDAIGGLGSFDSRLKRRLSSVGIGRRGDSQTAEGQEGSTDAQQLK